MRVQNLGIGVDLQALAQPGNPALNVERFICLDGTATDGRTMETWNLQRTPTVVADHPQGYVLLRASSDLQSPLIPPTRSSAFRSSRTCAPSEVT